MRTVPACAAVPEATRSVDDTNVVASGAPFQNTRAPATNRLPCTCSVKAPSGRRLGLRLKTHGVALRTEIVALPETDGLARLVAVAVTIHAAGGTAGAVYLPVESMVPTLALPPAMPLTDHVTLLLYEPFTYAASRR
jgi:hypothetical protein